MCILFHIRGDRLHRHLRAQHHARAGRHGRTWIFILKGKWHKIIYLRAQHHARAGRHGRTGNFLLKRDSGIRLFTFVLSTMPELAGMEELEIFY
jgi:hypothetical protein